MDATAWDDRYSSRELVWGAGPNRFLVEEVAGMPAGRALDLACGEGRNAIWLAERGWRVLGVDFSPVGIEKARRLAAERGVSVELEVADATDYEAAEEYDLVVVMYLQLPERQRRSALSAAARALAPAGTLLVVAHDGSNIAHGWGGPQDPGVLCGAEDVVADLGEGLVIERAGTVNRPVDTPDGERTAIDLLVRARRA